MSKEQLPCRFVPNDFTDSTSANVSRFLQPGISLGPMILVEEKPKSERMSPEDLAATLAAISPEDQAPALAADVIVQY